MATGIELSARRSLHRIARYLLRYSEFAALKAAAAIAEIIS